MAELTPEIDGPTVVLTGSFNPAIFHPVWFAKQGFLRQDEGKANVKVVSQQVTDFQLDWLRVQVTQDRFFAQVLDAGHALPLRDLAAGTFTYLEHTPITAMGINRMMHFRMPSQTEWHQVGDALAPKDFWKSVLAGRPGLRSLTIEGQRPDSSARWFQVKVEPSRNVPNGVYVESNEHYVIAGDDQQEEVKGLGAAKAYVDLLSTHWVAAQEFALNVGRKICQQFSAPRA